MPLITLIGLIAKAAESSGADALTVANTYLAMAIDFSTEKSRLGNFTGGAPCPGNQAHYSPLGLEGPEGGEDPYRWFRGVETAEDVLDSMCVGAPAVQVGTASFAGPRASEAIIESLGALVRTINCNTINELRDRLGADFG